MRRRFFIVGTIGSGKTTLAGKIAKRLGVENHSLDDYYWSIKYSRKRNVKVRDKMVKALVKKENWVVEGVFSSWVGPIVKRADFIIWLDMHPHILTKNILKRYHKMKITGKEKERGNFSEIMKTIKHAKKYRTGDHKNSYMGHLAMMKKYKPKYVRIEDRTQLKKLEKSIFTK